MKCKRLAFKLLIGVLFSIELFTPLMVIAETFDSSQIVGDTIEAESEDEHPSIITSSSSIDDTNLSITEITEQEILENENTMTVEAIQTENWHKDEYVHILSIKISRSNLENEFIEIQGLNDAFILSDEIVITGNPHIYGNLMPGQKIMIFGDTGDCTVEVFAKVTNVADVVVDQNNYFDFGKLAATYFTTSNSFIAEANSLNSVLLKAGIVQVNYFNTDGESLANSHTIFGIPGDNYSTVPRDFDEWRLVDTHGETEGFYTLEPITIDYTYTQKRLVFSALNHVDFYYGEVNQSSSTQTIYAKGEQAPTIVISDYSKSTIWDLRVSQPEGFKDSHENVLEGAIVKLSGFKNIASVHGSIRVNPNEIELSSSDSSIATMFNPFGDEENGETIIGIGEVEQGHLTGVKLTLNGNTIQNIGDYHTSIVWELVGDPTLGAGE